MSIQEIPEKCPDCGASIFSIDGKEWRCEDQRTCCWTNVKQIDKTRELIYEADKLHKEKNEIEFQKIAVELAHNHQRFIDEGNTNDREFALESLIAEYEYYDKNPNFDGIFDDTVQYLEISNKYFSKKEIEN